MDIWEVVLGFMDSQLVMTAEEVGVFTLLQDGGMSSEDLAPRAGLPEDSAQRLLNGLCALGVVQKTGSLYRNSPQAQRLLVRGNPSYVGDLFVHLREEVYPLWGNLKETLIRGGSLKQSRIPHGSQSHGTDPFKLKSFMDGMQALTYASALEFAAASTEVKTIRRLVDVGGAGGAFLIACAECHPTMSGIVLDLPQVRPIAEANIQGRGMTHRLKFQGSDFFEDPIPDSADAFSLGFILHDWNDAQCSRLLSNVAGAARTGSYLIVSEYLLSDDKTSPRHVVRSDLNMLVSANGRERSYGEYTMMMQEHGFEPVRTHTTASLRVYMVFQKGHPRRRRVLPVDSNDRANAGEVT